MQGRSHSLSDASAYHRALIALVCVGMVLLSGSVPAPLAGAGWLPQQTDDCVAQIEAQDDTASSVRLGLHCAEDRLEDWVELAEPTDDDETKHYLLRLDVAAVFGSPTGLYESSADRKPIPFRLHAFSSRGSPSA